MTTILNVFGPSNGNCTVSADTVCQYPTFLSCSPNSTESSLYNRQFFLDTAHDGPVQNSSSSKTPASDAFSLGSLERFSASSEKSIYQDFSDGHFPVNNLTSSELTDPERSNSTNSLSSNSRRNSIMSDESSARHLETSVDCCQPNFMTYYALNNQSGGISVSCSAHNSSVMYPTHQRIYQQSCQQNALVNTSKVSFNVDRSYNAAFCDSQYKYVPYGIPRQLPYSHKRSPSLHSARTPVNYKELLSFVSSDHPNINNYPSQVANSLHSMVNGVQCNLDVQRGGYNMSNYQCSIPSNYANLDIQKKIVNYRKNLPNHYSYCHSAFDSAVNKVNNRGASQTQRSVYYTLNYQQNNQLSPTNDTSADSRMESNEPGCNINSCSVLSSDKIVSSCHRIGESSADLTHTVKRNTVYQREYPLCDTSNSHNVSSTNLCVSINTINKPMTTRSLLCSQQCTNEVGIIPATKDFSIHKTCDEVKISKHKRRGEKNPYRTGKRRQPNVDIQTTLNCPATELIVRSLLLQDVRKYLQNPVLYPTFSVYPPSPLRPAVIDQDMSVLGFNQVPTRYAFKYQHFPLCLSKPETKPSEDYILHFLSSTPKIECRMPNLMSNNFLIETHRRAAIRNSSSTYFSPSSPTTPCSPLVKLESEHSFLAHKCGRVSPIAETKCEGRFNQISNPIETYPVEVAHREEIISFDQLTAHKRIICSNCSMQIVAPNKSLTSRFQGKDRCIPFCSETCLLEYQKQLNNSANRNYCVPEENNFSTISTTFSDGPSALAVFILKCGATKPPKSNSKRSSNEMRFPRRKQTESSLLNRVALNKSCIVKRWRNIRWRRWTNRFHSCKINSSADAFSNACVSDPKKRMDLMLSFQPDERVCCLCHNVGDGVNNITNRLLNFDVGSWLHLNCILWCYDTYETISGSLVDVNRSYEKAIKTQCAHCKMFGAGLPCFDSECEVIYHLPCANKIGCSFYSDRSMYCPKHYKNEEVSKLETLTVNRRVYITRDEDSQVAKVISCEDLQVRNHLPKLRIGTLILHRIGQLLPDHLESGLFHNSNFIYPVGFWSTRIYWSYRRTGQRCRYDCRIESTILRPESDNEFPSKRLLVKFVVDVIEPNQPTDHFEDSTCNGVWQQILTKINSFRRAIGSRYLKVFQDRLQGEVLYGFTEPQIIRAIESLPGVDYLTNYIFKFGKLQLIKEMPLALNPTGCARSEAKSRTYVRRKPSGDAHNSSHNLLNHKILGSPTCSNSSEVGSPSYFNSQSPNLISKFQQYRRLRYEWKTNVFLARSRIQGLGLYAARDISKHTFIIEYLGEMIRNEVGNLRERLYESQNRGVYMFRVDEDWIVDATMCGGLARYINHSCDPNCSAEILNCDNGNHIVIIANKNIEKGDEITYDYKFDLEEDRWDRIPCLCGSNSCRKWMN